MSGGDGGAPAGTIRRVCVVGSGGREHALALALGRTADVVVIPGNPGIEGRTPEGHTLESVAGSVDDAEAIARIDADLFVIGPEAPLVDGLADRLRAEGRLVFGPGADGARLEGSKAFMKEVLAAAGVPTARFEVFDEAGTGPLLSCGPARPLGHQDRRAGRRQGRPRHVDRGPRRRPTSRPSSRARPSAPPGGASWSRKGSPASSAPCSCCATGAASPRWRRPRTSSGWATATPGPTPGAWAPTRRCPSSRTPGSTRWPS